MRKRDENGEDIQKLEDEIRKLGVPYADDEPEPLYWANFRVRVMERVAQKEQKVAWPARVVEYIAEHILGASIVVSAACLLIAAILWMQPSGSEVPQLALVRPPASAPAPIAQRPLAVNQPVVNQPATLQGTHRSNRSYKLHDMAKAAKSKAQSADDLASIATPIAVPVASDEGEPVSLQSLSQPQLEAVLQNLETQ